MDWMSLLTLIPWIIYSQPKDTTLLISHGNYKSKEILLLEIYGLTPLWVYYGKKKKLIVDW
jgi:hypothetical protein